MILKIKYYKLPVSNIPFKQIPSLESVSYSYVYCSSFPLKEFMGIDYELISIYNTFDTEVEENDERNLNELLFGEVVSEKLPVRGKYKCLELSSEERDISALELPDLKYSPDNNYSSNGRWFYMKEGKYVILSGIKSEYEKVKHLEGINVYGEHLIRLRIVLELLKKNVKNEKLKLSLDDYKTIAFRVLKADPVLIKANEDIIWDGVNNWVPSMILTPLYDDVPENLKGRAIV